MVLGIIRMHQVLLKFHQDVKYVERQDPLKVVCEDYLVHCLNLSFNKQDIPQCWGHTWQCCQPHAAALSSAIED